MFKLKISNGNCKGIIDMNRSETCLKSVSVWLPLVSISFAFSAGEFEQTFNGGVSIQPTRNVIVIKPQPNEKILVGSEFDIVKGGGENFYCSPFNRFGWMHTI